MGQIAKNEWDATPRVRAAGSWSFQIKLVSKDPDLYKLCREIVAEIGDANWTVSAVESVDEDPEADLYIWDFHANLPPPTQIHRNPTRNLFLVHRKDLADFRRRNEATEANILLKPVTRPTLAAFLSLALSAQKERVAAANFLRADRDEMLQCLIQTNLKLQEYDLDRTNFLARAVHDFRAPLTAIIGYCGLLMSQPFGALNESQLEVLTRMQHSAKRLSRMASAMFQLSVGRQVKKQPDFQQADLQQRLDQALHEIGPFAEEKRISVTADLVPPGFPLFFEPSQIEQILINLLDNACKFTPRGGTAEVMGYPYFWERRKTVADVPASVERRRTSTDVPNAYRVDVRDSGPGIPPVHLRRIFEEYTSYGGGRDRSGGGLGLAICKMIALQHNGDIWAENTDFGPCFSFVLPYQQPPPPSGAAGWSN